MRLTIKYMLFVLPLIFITERMSSQTLTSVDSDIWNPVYGVTYRLSPNPDSPNPITPERFIIPEVTGPIKFILTADPGSIWLLSFLLPDSLTDGYHDGGTIYCSYDDSSGYHVQDKSYWNAGRTHSFTTDSLGVITVGIGMTFSAGSCPIGWGYAENIVCLATRLSDGFTLIDTSRLTISSSVTDQCGWGMNYVDASVDNLTAGFSYSIDPESGNIQPVISGQEHGGYIQFAESGIGREKISIDFLLPNYLEGDAGRIPISFSSTSARESSGRQWDPKDGYITFLDQNGNITVNLGFTIEVPDTTKPGEYYGMVVFFVSYVGNSLQFKNKHMIPHRISEPYAIITVKTLPAIPKVIYLYPNFPNPFNSSTTIKYDLPVPGDVTLKIYDVLGRETATLVNGFQFGGEHSVQWDGASFPSGVYVYRLQVGSFSQTRKIILMR